MDLNTARATKGGPLDNLLIFVKAYLDKLFTSLDMNPATDLDVAYVLIGTTFVCTLVSYYTVCGRRHTYDRQSLDERLHKALKESQFLQGQLDDIDQQERQEELERLAADKLEGKEIRVFVEGAFDLMHYGHANAFRQAREVGTYLVAGVNSSETIEQCKGAPPVLNDKERCAVVGACKWVDEVIEKSPYVMTPEYLDMVIKKYKIDYVIHGDDPCIGPDGKDVYAHVKERGMFRSIPRTEGVSTTEIVGRMLQMTKSHHRNRLSSDDETTNDSNFGKRVSSMSPSTSSPKRIQKKNNKSSSSSSTGLLATSGRNVGRPRSESNSRFHFPFRKSRFITTSRMIRLFSQPAPKPITPTTKVVYINGGWDMFHSGHAKILEKAKKLGDYLLVGIYNDGIINQHRGGTHPVLNLQERVLSVLACKYVDDVGKYSKRRRSSCNFR